jgi:cytochrome b-561 domain-containing protein 2
MATINKQNKPNGFYDMPFGQNSDTFSITNVRPGNTMVDEPERPEGRKGDTVGKVVLLLGLGVFLIGTWLIVFLNKPGNLGLFAAHPPLQTLAITCFALGIMTLQPTSQPRTKASGLTRHQVIILGLGVPAILTGTIMVFFNKVIKEANHFTTWHGTFGGIALVWMVFQILLGGLSVWFRGAALGGGAKAKRVWRYHRASGYLLFPMFLLTAAVGGNYSDYVVKLARITVGVRVLVYTIAPIAILLGLWSRIRLSKMNFRA